jgi:hypothetical protein
MSTLTDTLARTFTILPGCERFLDADDTEKSAIKRNKRIFGKDNRICFDGLGNFSYCVATNKTWAG